jgi:hypothetical protein
MASGGDTEAQCRLAVIAGMGAKVALDECYLGSCRLLAYSNHRQQSSLCSN